MKTKINHSQDDLTRIKGIGVTTASLLKESLNISSFADLIKISPEELKNSLKSAKLSNSLTEIKKWQLQASEFMDPSDSLGDQPFDNKPTNKKSPVSTITNQQELCDKEASWETFDTFILNFQIGREQLAGQFQTHCERAETNETGEVWSGIDVNQPLQWIRAQVADKKRQLESRENVKAYKREQVAGNPDEEISEAVASNRKPASLGSFTIAEIRAIQPVFANKYHSLKIEEGDFHTTIDAKSPVLFEIRLKVEENDFNNLPGGLSRFMARLKMYNRSTSEHIKFDMSEVGTFSYQDHSFTLRTPETYLNRGIYRIDSNARLEGNIGAECAMALPVLRVA
jgi:hypothetical protein